ncbi:MAG: cysteine hydrolase [Alphaproteobacteria bacterium]|nr:cysteine hydrolase [Alphaproteobacteria bacterium]
MITIDNHLVFTEIEEVLDPRHTALVIIDAQNDFCAPDGMFAKNGSDMSAIPPAVANIRRLIDAARPAGAMVIYIQNQKMAKNKSVSGAWLRFVTARAGLLETQYCCLIGSPGAEIIDELKPEPDDIVVKKWRSSSFVGTNLDMILRNNGIRTTLCCGFITQGCVESTARDAGFYDYYPVVVEDAVGNYHKALHEASLFVQRSRYDVVPTERVLQVWEKSVPQLRR